MHEVVHALLVREGVSVSLSSVKRIAGTYCAPLKRKSVWARTRKYARRPEADHPGALVEMDTIHFFDTDGVKRYVYTALDVYSRAGYRCLHRLVQHETTASFSTMPHALRNAQSDSKVLNVTP